MKVLCTSDHRLSQRPKIAMYKVTKNSDRYDSKCDLCVYKGANAKYLIRHIDAVH